MGNDIDDDEESGEDNDNEEDCDGERQLSAEYLDEVFSQFKVRKIVKLFIYSIDSALKNLIPDSGK